MELTIYTYKSKGYALVLALLPVVMMYEVPILDLGLSTVLIATGMIYAMGVIMTRLHYIRISLLLPFILYFTYITTKSDATNVLLSIAIIVHLIAISAEAVDSEFLEKSIVVVSIIATIGIIIQFLVHLLFNVHVPMIISELCLKDLVYYDSLIRTGVGRHEAMYRPSAFFLEPSHMAMYCIIALCICLLRENVDYKKAVFISVGIILTTSGMGIVLVAGVWLIFPFVTEKGKIIKKLKRVLILGVLAVSALLVLSQTEFFKNALARISGPISYSSNQYNAIWGRTVNWKVYITPMGRSAFLWGYGSESLPDVFFTGWMTIIYSYGLVGLILLYCGLLLLFYKCRNISVRIVIAIYAVMLSLADLSGFINMIFYVGIAITYVVDSNRNVLRVE